MTDQTPTEAEWRSKFDIAFQEITNEKNWMNGRPVYNGIEFVTVYNALVYVVDTLLAAERQRGEQLEVQLAGCLTAAEGWNKHTAKEGDYGWSVAYQKILELRNDRDSMKNGDLVSNCCAADFDPMGYEKEEGIWQERCLKCGKLCEPLYLSKREIANIQRLDSLTTEEEKNENKNL